VQVSGGNGAIGYQGYATNYSQPSLYTPNLGPAIPGGFPVDVGAFFNVSNGKFGVSGSGPSTTGDTGAAVYYDEAFQFASSGTITLTSHFQGVIGTGGSSSAFFYEYGDLDEFVGIRDDTSHLVGFDQASSANLCGITLPGLNGCYTSLASSAAINTDLVVSYDVVQGRTYTVQVSLTGTQIGDLTFFDGIDPSSLSIALSPGLTFAATPGFDPPAFVTGSSVGTSVPEPETLPLMGLVGVGFWIKRKSMAATLAIRTRNLNLPG
jgi:hypothetical protein